MLHRYTNPSSGMQESNRKLIENFTRASHRQLQRKMGRIIEVSENKTHIRVAGADGRNVAGGDFIPVADSPLDIVARFGALRKGLRVIVTFIGEVENNPLAQLIGFEDEDPGNELLINNEITTNLYEIFVPGIGV